MESDGRRKILLLVLINILNGEFVWCTTPGPMGSLTKPTQEEEKTAGDLRAENGGGRSGESVIGTYRAAEPSGDVRIVDYVADETSGFKARAHAAQPVASSPLKLAAAEQPQHAVGPFGNFRSGISPPVKYAAAAPPPSSDVAGEAASNASEIQGPFGSFRTGIAPPARVRKPARGFNPIVVRPVLAAPASLVPAPSELPQSGGSLDIAATQSKKSMRVDAAFSSEVSTSTVEPTRSTEKRSDVDVMSAHFMDRIGDGASTASATPTPPPPRNYTHFNNLFQLKESDIPSSIMDILSHSKAQEDLASTEATKLQSEASTPSARDSLHLRPMRLIGLGPSIFMDGMHLQHLGDSGSGIPHLSFEAVSNAKYADLIPHPPLTFVGGMISPLHNNPRSANEPPMPPIDQSVMNAFPLINALSIFPPMPSSHELKSEMKQDEKGLQNPIVPCKDCIIPANYIPYPVMKSLSHAPPSNSLPAPVPFPIPAPAPAGAPSSVQKNPCANSAIANGLGAAAGAPTSLWPSYTPGLAYVLMPASFIKGKMMNDTHPAL